MAWSESFVPFGGGRKAPMGGLCDLALTGRLREYKRAVATRYQVLSPLDLKAKLPGGRLWISTKVDGELWFLVQRGGDVALCAYNGRVLHDVPITHEARERLSGLGDCIIAGKLLGLTSEGRPRVMHVAHALSLPDGDGKLQFQAFDVLELGGLDVSKQPYSEKLARLQSLLGEGGHVRLVHTEEGDASRAVACFDDWVGEAGGEGMVVRADNGATFKVKPSFSIDAVIVAYGEKREEGAVELGEVDVALMRDDGTFQIVGAVGCGWNKAEQAELHQRLVASRVPSTFRLPSHDGMLCRFVRPEIVVEVKANELVDVDSHDEPLRRMTLRYRPDHGFDAMGMMPIANLVFPVFLRERTDKLVDVGCVGLDQIFERAPFESRDEAARPVERAPATVVKRRVFVKKRGATTAVRKVLVLRRDQPGPEYPPYVVHFTDFSAGRREPLETGIRTAATEAGAMRFVEDWLVENVKRGWTEVNRPEGEAPVKPPPPSGNGASG
ncbi:MAG: hypothetical protein QM765_07990 [Myxococcales bacterium]